MANEVTLTGSIRVQKGPIYYSAGPSTFQANMGGSQGPSPGTQLVTTAGLDISLAALTALGGWCRIQNYGPPGSVGVGPPWVAADYVTWGIKQGANFYPLGELAAGEFSDIRLSRLILAGSGGGAQTFRFVANSVSQVVLVAAFDQ